MLNDAPHRKFNANCTRCARLAQFLKQGKLDHPDYYCKPVPQFGADPARLLIIGLAPGFHGANATGRPFTGDYAGILLYDTLYRFGFSNGPKSVSSDDKLKLRDARITNSVKCVPPENKPLPAEIRQCNDYLKAELTDLKQRTVLLALGTVAHNATLRALGLKASQWKFSHGAEHALPQGHVLLDSYHCSRYNTNTGRLTEVMFHTVFARARKLVDALK